MRRSWIRAWGALAGLLVLFLVGFCPLPYSPSSSADSSLPEPSELIGGVHAVLGSWNLWNLFDTVDDAYNDDVLTEPEYTSKLRILSQVIDGLAVDVLGVQEVETLECLQDLNRSLSRPFQEVVLVPGNDRYRGIQVGLLSRFPVLKVKSHASTPLHLQTASSRTTRFSRDCLEVHLDTEPRLIVLTNHFKSQVGSKKESAQIRRAQAQGVMRIVVELKERHGAEALVVVLGDFNDQPHSWALEPLMSGLLDPLEGLPASWRATHRYGNFESQLDYVLVDPDARERVVQAWVAEDVKMASDHRPVLLQLRLDRAPQ